jgi:hypothetical protein
LFYLVVELVVNQIGNIWSMHVSVCHVDSSQAVELVNRLIGYPTHGELTKKLSKEDSWLEIVRRYNSRKKV